MVLRSGLLHGAVSRRRRPVRRPDLRTRQSPGVVQAAGGHAEHLGGPEGRRPEASVLQSLSGGFPIQTSSLSPHIISYVGVVLVLSV